MKIVVEFESVDKNDKQYERKFMQVLSKVKSSKVRIINILPSESITFDIIEKSVCNFEIISIETLQSKTKKREIVIARQLCHYIAKRANLGYLNVIGDRFGDKDYSTVKHGINTISNLIESDLNFKKKYQSFIESFFSHETAKA